jgi:hypothetical protein
LNPKSELYHLLKTIGENDIELVSKYPEQLHNAIHLSVQNCYYIQQHCNDLASSFNFVAGDLGPNFYLDNHLEGLKSLILW